MVKRQDRASLKPDRPSRVADNVFRFLSEILVTKVSDPRLQRVTITGVDISPDLRNGIVFFSILDDIAIGDNTPVALPKDGDEYSEYVNRVDEEAIKSAKKAFRSAEGFLKQKLSLKLKLPRMPALKFEYDASYRRGQRLSEIMNNVNSKPDEEDNES